MLQIADSNDIPQEFEAEIEKLSNQGYGIARKDGYVVFVENACPGDVAVVKLTKKHKTYAYANIVKLLTPSVHRCEPICPMQKICGACQFQFIDYNFQLEQKKQIVIDSIKGLDVEVRDVIPSPKIREYRRKIQYPVSETRNSKRILAGYYKANSHNIVNIKYCPIQPGICDEIIDFIRNSAPKFSVSGYNEKEHSGALRHIVIRSSEYTEKNLLVLDINSKNIPEEVKLLARNVYEHFDEVSGVCVNLNSDKTNLILGKKTELIIGEPFVEEKLCNKVFKVGADTFFQVNPQTANNIFDYVRKYISDNHKHPSILDAYAGISAFGICLSDVAKKVVCVESVKASVELASEIIKENNINNIELYNMDAEKFFKSELNKNSGKFDITVLDPPRKGCTTESLDNIIKITENKIIYVSCNPATLARDLKYMTGMGCKVDYIQPFDMFPHTYHIENVAVISKLH